MKRKTARDRKANRLLGVLAASWYLIGGAAAHPTCKFDRNEPAPQGWWWDIYKCSDGTERRELVASPRG